MVRWTDHPAMTIAVDLGRKATKQTNNQPGVYDVKINVCAVSTLSNHSGSAMSC